MRNYYNNNNPQTNPQGYPQTNPQGYPQTNPQGYPQTNPQGYPQANPQGYQNQQNIQFNGNVYPANAQGYIYSQQNIQAQLSPEQQVWELNQAYMYMQNLNQMYLEQVKRDAYIASLLKPVDKTVTAEKVYCKLYTDGIDGIVDNETAPGSGDIIIVQFVQTMIRSVVVYKR